MRSTAKALKSRATRGRPGIIKEETDKTLKHAELVAAGTMDQFLGIDKQGIGRIENQLGS